MRITDMITEMNLLDILLTSPHYFCRKWMGATDENSNCQFKGLSSSGRKADSCERENLAILVDVA